MRNLHKAVLLLGAAAAGLVATAATADHPAADQQPAAAAGVLILSAFGALASISLLLLLLAWRRATIVLLCLSALPALCATILMVGLRAEGKRDAFVIVWFSVSMVAVLVGILCMAPRVSRLFSNRHQVGLWVKVERDGKMLPFDQLRLGRDSLILSGKQGPTSSIGRKTITSILSDDDAILVFYSEPTNDCASNSLRITPVRLPYFLANWNRREILKSMSRWGAPLSA